MAMLAMLEDSELTPVHDLFSNWAAEGRGSGAERSEWEVLVKAKSMRLRARASVDALSGIVGVLLQSVWMNFINPPSSVLCLVSLLGSSNAKRFVSTSVYGLKN